MTQRTDLQIDRLRAQRLLDARDRAHAEIATVSARRLELLKERGLLRDRVAKLERDAESTRAPGRAEEEPAELRFTRADLARVEQNLAQLDATLIALQAKYHAVATLASRIEARLTELEHHDRCARAAAAGGQAVTATKEVKSAWLARLNQI